MSCSTASAPRTRRSAASCCSTWRNALTGPASTPPATSGSPRRPTPPAAFGSDELFFGGARLRGRPARVGPSRPAGSGAAFGGAEAAGRAGRQGPGRRSWPASPTGCTTCTPTPSGFEPRPTRCGGDGPRHPGPADSSPPSCCTGAGRLTGRATSAIPLTVAGEILTIGAELGDPALTLEGLRIQLAAQFENGQPLPPPCRPRGR